MRIQRETLKRDIGNATDLLSRILACAGPSYIIIDGLDEIGEFERGRLMGYIISISKTCDESKFLISSRPESDISAKLTNEAIVIRIDRRNTGSIQAFVNQWVQQWFLDREFLLETRDEILGHLSPLASKSKGETILYLHTGSEAHHGRHVPLRKSHIKQYRIYGRRYRNL